MGCNRPKLRAGRPWRILLALVCVLLVVVSGAVQVAHTHAGGADTHANCPLCVAAHVTIHHAQMPAPAPLAAVFAVLESVAPRDLPSNLSTFALFTRPPPAAAIVPA
jgi:hypothetical protein